ncbi:rhs family protein (plasmid) [Candidatus Protochlamydia naegleriophila]|uniref:Rhs family protein n=1 Tax=Candidatus Protochlamydia naegleriophila TaxID=389348 RepID=A0A0U5JDM7_9BACT|nr:rhs family protein [Candidatus Protochlamydia naegleriophila]
MGNPWRFASKRVDPETGWVYFGRRFYDPSNGRWTTTDPLGFADGPNLYAYLHHSPLSAFDAYGLVGEAYRDGCNVATNPNYFDGISNEYSPVFGDNAGNDAWLNVQKQEWFESAVAGFVHGCVNFVANTCQDFHSLFLIIGMDNLDVSMEEKLLIYQAHITSQNTQIAALDGFVQETMGIDAKNATYQAARDTSLLGLELASLAVAITGAVKAVTYCARLSRLAPLEAKMAKCLMKQEVKAASTSIKPSIKSIGNNITDYVPKSTETGKPLPLPRNKHGANIPSSNSPHTQIGIRSSDKGDYKQTRQWGYDGKEIKTTDWTDHGTPNIHPNPHDHLATPNPTGGTPGRGDAVPFQIIINP